MTGFEPFGGQRVNPSSLAVLQLDGEVIADHAVVARVLPVTFAGAPDAVMRAVHELRPAVVICVGEAGGRAEINVERVAINLADARIPDNAGAQPRGVPLETAGPVGYWATLPVEAIVHAVGAAGIPAVASNHAGAFVCNATFYRLMRLPVDRAGFIHVPYTLEQGAAEGKPSLPVDRVAQALRIAIRVSLTH